MVKVFIPFIALALASPFNLADFDNGADIYARSADSVTSDSAITIDGTEVTEFPHSFSALEEKSYEIKQGDKVFSLHIDNTAPDVEIDGVEDGKLYRSASVRIKAPDASEIKIVSDGKEVEYKDDLVLNFTDTGNHKITVTASDKAGNETEKTVSFSTNSESPVIKVTGLDKRLQNTPYDINVSISSKSKITELKATLDHKDVDIDSPIKVDEEGFHELEISCKDEVGNTGYYYMPFSIDYTAPKMEAYINDDKVEKEDCGFYRSATIDFVAEGELGTDVYLNGKKQNAATLTVKEDGDYTAEATAYDEAGNKTVIKLRFSVLNEAPVIKVTGIDKPLKNSAYKIKVETTSKAEVKDEITLNGEKREKDGLPEKEFTVSEEGEYTLKVRSVDSVGNASEEEFRFEVDKTKPELALSVKAGYVNTDAPYSVSAKDKNLDDTVLMINGKKQESLSGTFSEDGVYKLEAYATDKAGNRTESEKTVIVDKTAPVISINDVKYTQDLTRVRATADDTNFDKFSITAKHGDDIITTDITDKKELLLPEDAKGESAADVWHFTFVAVDKAGNVTTETKSIVRDTTAPVITLKSAKGHVNKDVKVSAAITDPYIAQSVLTIKKDGKDYSTDKGIKNLSRLLKAEGTYAVTVESTDKAGNRSKRTSTFVIDKTPPVTTLRSSDGHVQRADTVSVSSNEPGKTFLKVVCDGKKLYSGTKEGSQSYSNLGRNGVYTLESYSIDLAGNKSKVEKGTFTVDTVAPDISLSGARQNAYINTPVTITAECNERFFKTTKVNISGRIAETGEGVSIPFTCIGQNTSISETLHKNGTYHLKMTAVDAAGNSSSTNEMVFTIDTEKPVVEVSVPTDGRYNATVAPKVTIKDDYFEGKDITLSGGKEIHFKDSFDEKGGTRSYSDFVRIKENDGRYTLTARATDKAGNSTTVSKSFIVNRFGSVFKTVKKPSEYGKKADKNVVITETNVSGIKSWKCEISKDANLSEAKGVKVETKGDVSTYTVPKSDFAEDGVYKVYITSQDNSGNTSKSEGEFSFVVDNAPPVITYTGIEEGAIYKEESRKVYVSATDTLTEKPKVEVRSNGKKLKVDEDENGTYAVINGGINQNITIKASDRAGNSSSQEIKDVTVSTSKLAFFSAHKGIAAGAGAGLIGAAGAAALLLAKKRKKDENEDKGDDLTF